MEKSRFAIAFLAVSACLTVFVEPAEAQRRNAPTVQFSDPIPGSIGDTLHATVAVLPKPGHPRQGFGFVTIEAFDADGLHLPPIATLRNARVRAGGSTRLDIPFQKDGQWIVLKAKIRQRIPGSIAGVAGSAQTSGVNQLWGDWFYVDVASDAASRTSPPILGTYGDRLRTTVGVAPRRSSRPGDQAHVIIEAFDADGTDLAPLARLEETIAVGASLGFEIPFAPGSGVGDLQGIVLRTRIVPVRPGAGVRGLAAVALDPVGAATLLLPYFAVGQ